MISRYNVHIEDSYYILKLRNSGIEDDYVETWELGATLCKCLH
jgi:hypothetical protein